MLLIALDQSIVATAIPHIVSQFNALSDVSWVASAYFLTQVSLSPLIISSNQLPTKGAHFPMLHLFLNRAKNKQAGFILFFGGVLSIAPTKWVFMAAVTLFEVGSLVCGVAPNMNVLIFGRALSGVGAAGIFGSCIAIIAEIAPLEKRPALLGSFGGIFALASVCEIGHLDLLWVSLCGR